MAQIWKDNDVALDALKDKTVAVIGYGIQGRAQALNMRDSGLKVIVGLHKEGSSWNVAVKDGQQVFEVVDAARKADVIHVLVPDMVQAKVFKSEIQGQLEKGKALGFSHGASIHWKWVVPPEWVDVIMVAPKGPGARVRELYLEGFGVPALVAVQNDYTGKAWDRVLALGKGTGCARAGLVKTNFKEEVETDWFGEQVDLCGGVEYLIKNSFDTLVEAGYQPEVAYFECLHELKLIVDLVQKYGISGMYRRVSETARYGGMSRGGRVVGESSKQAMREALRDIQGGKFAAEWVASYEKKGKDAFESYLKELEEHPVEKVGKDLRKMMRMGEEGA